MNILFAAINRFRDAQGAGVKTEYTLGQSSGGGDGMNFALGTEVFQWNSECVPSGVKPRHIVSLRVDTSQLTAGKSLTINAAGRNYVVAAGSTGYVIVALNAPFTMSITSGGGTGVVNVSAYDYNALFTGTHGSVGPAGQSASGVSGGSSQPFGGSDIGPFGTDGFGPL